MRVHLAEQQANLEDIAKRADQALQVNAALLDEIARVEAFIERRR